jgi:S-formylglutathione hydrolase FrmB
MGGYGAIRIGMKRPDVFSSLYIMSACCLINNPLPAPPAAAKQNDTADTGGASQMNFAWSAAFSPNPKNSPRYFDEPISDGHLQPLVVARWHAASPLAMIDQYVTNLRKYHAVMLDVGLQDQYGLTGLNKQMEQMMTDFGITHTFETYEGDHTNRIPERVESKVLPFFSRNLATKKASR